MSCIYTVWTDSSPFSPFCNKHSCTSTSLSQQTSKYSDVHEQSIGFEFLRALKWRGTRAFVTMIWERFWFLFSRNPTFWCCDSEGCIFIVREIGYCLSTIVFSCVYCSVFCIGRLHDGVILLLLPESFSFFLSYLNFVIPVRFESPNEHKKAKPWRILVVGVKWCHRANGLLRH